MSPVTPPGLLRLPEDALPPLTYADGNQLGLGLSELGHIGLEKVVAALALGALDGLLTEPDDPSPGFETLFREAFALLNFGDGISSTPLGNVLDVGLCPDRPLAQPVFAAAARLAVARDSSHTL